MAVTSGRGKATTRKADVSRMPLLMYRHGSRGQSSPNLAEDYLRGEADSRGEDEISSSRGILDISRPVKMSRFRGRGWAMIRPATSRASRELPLLGLGSGDVLL